MTIRTKAMLTVGLGIGLFILATILLISKSYLTRMDQLEKDQFSLNVDRVSEFIYSSIKYLESKSYDWAIWDDSYKFIQDENEEFIESNVSSPLVFESLHINFMSFVNKNNEVVFEKAYDLKSLTQTDLPKSLHQMLDNQILNTKLLTSTNGYSGVINLDEGSAIISVRPILNSLGKGKVMGKLVFGRYIDEEFISDIKAATKQKKINFYNFSDPKLPKEEKEIISKLVSDGKVVENSNPTENEGWALLNDIYGKPALFFGIYGNRDIHLQAVRGVTALSAILGSSALLFTFVVWLILGKLVLNPLRNLANEINEITKNKDFSSRLKALGNDEFGTLANDINVMLVSLENLGFESEMKAHDLADKLNLIAQNNKDLEASKKAILNILEDEKQLQSELKSEKISVEKKIIERTKELNDEKSKLTASIEALAKAFVMVDTKGNISLTNENLDKVLGVKKNKWTMSDIQKALSGSFDFEEGYKKILKTKKRIEYEDISFGTKILQIRFSPVFVDISTGNSLLGVLAIIGDVTDEKVLERSKDEFFSIASHELRTPLTAIRGNTSMMLDYYKDQIKDPELKQMVTDTHDASIRLIGIVNDFLDLSRLEQKRMVYKKTDFKIGEIVSSVIKDLNVNANEKGIKLEAKVDDKIVVSADQDKVKQVLFNIIGNSIKFTEKGSVTVTSNVENELLKINIKDTGMGIPKEAQSLLFRKFQQAGKSTITRDGAKGTGLGLYISKLMVEGMGGKIYLEKSEVGKGSVFTFSLPLAKLNG